MFSVILFTDGVAYVADEIGITSVDENWELLEDTWNKTVERLHPVTLEEEVSVDVKVAAVICADLNTELSLDVLLVEELADPAKSRVAEVARILTLSSDIIDVLRMLVYQS